LLGSYSFIVYQIGRIGVVLFLPSIALNVVTGIDIFVCIGLMASSVWSIHDGWNRGGDLDGCDAGVCSDGRGLLSLVLITLNMRGDFQPYAGCDRKSQTAHVRSELINERTTVWVMLLGGMFAIFYNLWDRSVHGATLHDYQYRKAANEVSDQCDIDYSGYIHFLFRMVLHCCLL
jgi:hypothetical protein